MEQFSSCQSACTLKTALTWQRDNFSVLKQVKDKELSNGWGNVETICSIFQVDF